MASWQLPFSQALTANQLGYNPLSGSLYEYLRRATRITVLSRATGTSVRLQAFADNQALQERSPVQAGGTAGTTPSPLNTTPHVFDAPGGARLKLSIDEVGGLTPTVDGLIQGDELE